MSGISKEVVAEAMAKAQEQTGITEEAIQAALENHAFPGKVTPKPEPKPEPKEEETEEISVEAEEEVEEEEAEAEELDTEAPEVEGEETPGKRPTVPLNRFNKVYRKGKEMERYIQGLLKERDMMLGAFEAIKAQTPVAVEPAPPEPDFDLMTPGEIAKYQMVEMRRIAREESQALLTKEVEPLKQSGERAVVKASITEAAKAHADFWDYQDEMVQISRRHPTLNAEETYQLAKKDTAAVARSVAQRVKDKTALKKKAKVETRTSPTSKTAEQKTYKNWKEIGKRVAEEMGMI